MLAKEMRAHHVAVEAALAAGEAARSAIVASWNRSVRVHGLDPALREAFLGAFTGPPADLWPLFDACAGLPLALIRGANSDLLSAAVTAEMRRRRPDMIFAEVPDRAHIPFLDEPESLGVIHTFLKALQ